LAAGLFAGCAQQRTTDNYAVIRSGERAGDSSDSSFAYHYPATAPVLDATELKRFVDEHRNQVVVLEFWASWSSSSRDQIARLAKLHDEHRRDGLRVIACTFDEPREWTTHTVPVLHSAGANYPCVVIPRGARQSLGEWLDPAWRFDLPARFVVNRSGTIVARARGDEAVLAALDSWGSSRTRTRRAEETRPASPEPRARELRVATASATDAPSTRSERADTTRSDATNTSAAAPRRETTTRSSTTSSSRRYAASRRSSTTTRRPASSRYRSRSTSDAAESSPVRTASASSIGPASTRVKLVNVRTGESDWLPVVSRDDGLGAASDAVADAIRSRVGRSTNPRIAVAPLSSMRNRNFSTPLGEEAARRISDALKGEGYFDLVSPTRTERMLKDAGLSVTQIDFDASVTQGRIDADYLVIGWVRNDVDELIRARSATPTTRIAGDVGATDTGYVSPRREAEDFSDF